MSKHYSDFKKEQIIHLQGVVRADDFEERIFQHIHKYGKHSDILISLKNITFIEIAVLINIIAFIRQGQRDDQNYTVYFQYPALKQVRDFLCVWRFPEAVKLITKSEFRKSLIKEEHSYMDEEQTTYTGLDDSISMLEWDPDWEENYKLKRNFFEITGLVKRNHFIDDNPTSYLKIYSDLSVYGIPIAVSREWQEDVLVNAILMRYLKPITNKENSNDTNSFECNDIARVIIYETLSNAIRHSDANNIFMTSIIHRKKQTFYNRSSGIQKRNDKPYPSSFRFIVWDDGIDIAKTLSSLIEQGLPIKKNYDNLKVLFNEQVLVEFRKYVYDNNKRKFIVRKQKKEEIIHILKDPPKEKITEAKALLYSFFPGITQTQSRKVQSTDRFDDGTDLDSGLGLYALLKNVIYTHFGKIFVRSGKYRLQLEFPKILDMKRRKYNYLCKITEYPESYEFQGNLLSIQIPLDEE